MALVGEDHTDRAVMAEALNDDAAVTGADDIGAADAHVAGLLHGAVRTADIAMTAVPLEPVPTAAAIVVADDDTAAGTTERKFEPYTARSGGRSRSGKPGGGDNEGGECIANEAVHDCSPDVAAFDALSGCP
ncbi:hypothetical protein HOE425_320241 [Hoeflea sp. EC-HK425]|nr:hypothetical protein HOE425_320241 [Hoeflea sp. EC-HK425]